MLILEFYGKICRLTSKKRRLAQSIAFFILVYYTTSVRKNERWFFSMKKIITVKMATLTLLKKLAVSSAEKNANSTCYWYDNQPSLPNAVKKMRKF